MSGDWRELFNTNHAMFRVVFATARRAVHWQTAGMDRPLHLDGDLPDDEQVAVAVLDIMIKALADGSRYNPVASQEKFLGSRFQPGRARLQPVATQERHISTR